MLKKVCRLCGGVQDLVWVFDKQMADNMSEIIHVTSGVQICKTDTVTQMVCSTCCQITIKMYKFRTKSLKNDKDLKARSVEYKITKRSNTPATFELKSDIKITPLIPLKYKTAHPSVREAMKKYPDIKMPDSCLKSHIGVYITLLTDEVDEWFKEKNLTDEDITRLKREAYELANAPPKPPRRKRKAPREENSESASPTNSVKRAKTSNETKRRAKKTDSDKLPDESAKSVRDKSVKPKTQTENIRSEPSVKSPDKPPVLLSALPDDNKEKREEITFKSLLFGSKPAPSRSDKVTEIPPSTTPNQDVIEIPDPPPEDKTPKPTDGDVIEIADPPPDEGMNIVAPEVSEAAMFTSKPLVRREQKKTSNSEELLIVSDSEDGQNVPKTTDSSVSDPIVFDIDSSSNYSTTSSKTTFVEALELAPKGDANNQPDLSLVALAPKSHTLYTCKVCDSQHSSLKEMKYHVRRTHTKCPFCSKRFRRLVHRDEHVKSGTCINQGPIKLKRPKLELVRVDEDEEIRKKFASAFEKEKEEEVDVVGDPDAPVEYDAATAEAVGELEKFLNYAEVIPLTEQNSSSVQDEERSDDVICILDKEGETSKDPAPAPQEYIKVVHSGILSNINIHDNDVNVLRRILSQAKLKTAMKTQYDVRNVKNNPIVDGNTSRVKIFKNLWKQLHHYRIPVEIRYSPTVSVDYKPNKPREPPKRPELWAHMKPEELKPLRPASTTPSRNGMTVLNGIIETMFYNL